MSHRSGKSSHRGRRLLASLGAFALAGSVALVGASPAEAAPINCTSVGSSFDSVLIPGQCVKNRANARFTLIMQSDGNLVLYDTSGRGRVCWASSFGGGGFKAGDRAIFGKFPLGIALGIGETHYGLAVGHYSGWLFYATYRYDGADLSVTSKSYNVSVNDKGQLYAGYDQIGSC